MQSKDTSAINGGSLRVSSVVPVDPLRNFEAFKSNLSATKLKEESKGSMAQQVEDDEDFEVQRIEDDGADE